MKTFGGRPFGVALFAGTLLALGCSGIVVGWGAWPRVSSISPLLALFVLVWSCVSLVTSALTWRRSRFAGLAFIVALGFLLFPARFVVPSGRLFLPALVALTVMGVLGFCYLWRARETLA